MAMPVLITGPKLFRAEQFVQFTVESLPDCTFGIYKSAGWTNFSGGEESIKVF